MQRGLVLLASRLVPAPGRVARVGYVLLLIGLIDPALVDLSIQALGAPFLLPVAAIGLALLAVGTRRNPRVSGPSRLYGVLAHLGAGICWVLFGISVLRARAGTPA